MCESREDKQYIIFSKKGVAAGGWWLVTKRRYMRLIAYRSGAVGEGGW